MTAKTELKIEQFVSDYCWNNLPGDQTWSNNFYSCALGGYEIAQKQFKKVLRDKYNHLNSQLKTVNTLKLDKTVDQELRIKLENQIELVKWIEKNI